MSRRAPPSLVSSLIRAALLWAVPGLILVTIALGLVSRNSSYRGFEEPLEASVLGLIASVESDESGTLRLSRELPEPRFQRALSGRYWLIGTVEDGKEITPLLSSRSLYGASLRMTDETISELAEQGQDPVRFMAPGPDIDADETLRVVARQVVLPNMSSPVVVLAAADRAPVIRSIRNFILTAIALLSGLTLGLIFAVYAQVRLGLKPLFALVKRIADVREGRAVSVEGDYPLEISPLALRNEAEAAKTTPSEIVSRQTDSMAAQVDHHLRRARAAARGQAIGVRADMDPVIDGLVRTLPRIYRDKDLTIDRTGETGLIFRGHPRDLEDMIGNLMDNAAKWTASRIDVDIFTVEDGICTVTISDDGPGLTEPEIQEALKRGARLDEATPGSGLGLSIVKDLADAYNGTLTFSRAESGGLKAKLRLPIAVDL